MDTIMPIEKNQNNYLEIMKEGSIIQMDALKSKLFADGIQSRLFRLMNGTVCGARKYC